MYIEIFDIINKTKFPKCLTNNVICQADMVPFTCGKQNQNLKKESFFQEKENAKNQGLTEEDESMGHLSV